MYSMALLEPKSMEEIEQNKSKIWELLEARKEIRSQKEPQINLKENEKYFSHWVYKFALLLVSVQLNPKYKKYENLHIIFFLIFDLTINIILQTIGLIKATTLIDSMDTGLFIVTKLCISWALFTMHRNRHHLLLLYRNCTAKTTNIDDQFLKKVDQVLKRPVIFFAAVVIGIFVGCETFPIVVKMFTDVEYGSPATLIFPSWYPWTMTKRNYAFTMMYQMVIASTTLSVCCGMVLIIFSTRIVISVHFEKLRAMIRDLNKVKYEYFTEENNKFISKAFVMADYDKRMLGELHRVIDYHQFFVETVNSFISGVRNSMDVTMNAFFVANIIFPSGIILIEGNYIYRLEMINAHAVACVCFFLQCFVGEYLRTLNDVLMEEIYGTEWFNQSIEYRKQVLTQMTLLQTPLEIKLFGVYTVGYALVMSSIKTTYSVIQVVLSTQK